MLSNEEFIRRAIPFLKSEYFHDRDEKIIFEHIDTYFSKYTAIPTVEALSIDIDNNSEVSEDDFATISEFLSEFKPQEYQKPNEEWLLQQAETFCQDKAVYNAIMESIGILEEASDKSKTAIPDILNDALSVSFDTDIGHDYLEDSDERYEFYHKRDTHIPFGLEYFDKITKGGVVRKTLNVFMGGPGTGKTLALCHFAASYLTQGKNVLYITLEMAEERISERIDANLLNVAVDDLLLLEKEKYTKKVERIKQKTTGKLIVKEFPTASAGAGHFRHLMNELKIKKNFDPDIVIIDYINICCSSRLKSGSNVNSYTLIKSIAEELRGLAVEKNVPILTATQVNREGYGSSDIGMENTAESFGLPATADLFLAFITSDEMDELGQLMIKQLKNRYATKTENRKFVVGIDYPKMRLYDVEQRAQNDIVQEKDLDIPAFDKTNFGKNDSKKDFSIFDER